RGRHSGPISTFVAAARMARAKPASSSTVSPRTRSAVRKADVSTGVDSPHNNACMACSASCSERARPAATAWSKSRMVAEGMIKLGFAVRALSVSPRNSKHSSKQLQMKIHEYQAKTILAKYKVPVPRGEVAFTVAEAETAAKNIGGSVVIKAQIHAGGRGKGGGVKVAQNSAEAATIAEQILGMTLITHQTGPEGRVVQRVLVEETLPIDKELYLGIVLDRAAGQITFMASAAGGMEIEEVAAKTPEAILKEFIDPGLGLMPYQARNLAFGIGIPTPAINGAVAAMMALSKACMELDASLAEINPFILTKDNKVYA